LPHGKGIKVWQNGNVYEGQWKEGNPVGFGTKKFINGIVRKGQWFGKNFVFEKN
jgi:hypothetical protein